LVRVRDDFPVWSGRFERELTDIFTIQDEISRGIVNGLRLKLGQGRRRYETNVEAYDLYLHARALTLQRGVQGWAQSVEPFEQVIARDRSFAPAYAGLAAAYSVRSTIVNLDHPIDELTKMRVAAEKAIQLDPLLAEAHDALGMVYARDGKWERAEMSFRHAIELDRNRSTTYEHFAVWLLIPLGRVDQAVKELLGAEKADPLSPQVQQGLAFALISAGHYDEAAGHCQKLGAEDSMKRQFMGRAQLGHGKIDEAIPLLEEDGNQGFIGWAYARSGRREEAERLAAANSSRPAIQALIYAGLGDKDRTIEALNRMAAGGATRVGQYLTYPELTVIRGDPRVKALRKKVGLPM
jgi:tetratricopeptide (TPR) repeat protein